MAEKGMVPLLNAKRKEVREAKCEDAAERFVKHVADATGLDISSVKESLKGEFVLMFMEGCLYGSSEIEQLERNVREGSGNGI